MFPANLRLHSVMRRDGLIAFLLFLATLALYWPVQHFNLIYFDDPMILDECPPVQAGITWAGIQWAFGDVFLANWHPLTSLSFMAVAQFFGIAPGPHHLVNAILHAANAGLLFLVLRRLTGAAGRSLVVAAIFAWHPQRVESVAWIMERKDVLCGFFFLLAVWFYVNWRQRMTAGNLRGQWSFAASLAAYALALLSKPMAVTLPFVLLLLDFWPLQRFSPPAFRAPLFWKLVWEKWPFFLLTLAACVLTFRLQHDHAAMVSWERLGWEPRVATAVNGYVAYLGQFFWPADLAVMYPYQPAVNWLETGLKAALLVMISVGCLVWMQRRPYLIFGWCWYLGTALPVIGLVQVGQQSHADRYTYLPLIGIVMALVWWLADGLSRPWQRKRLVLPLLAVLLPVLWGWSAWQLAFWRDTITLFARNVEVTPENGAAHFTLGLGYEHAGDTNRAFTCYRVARMLAPEDPQIHRNLAVLLTKTGQLDAAQAAYAEMRVRFPGDSLSRVALAAIWLQTGQREAAMAQLDEALRISPDSPEVLNNLAWELATSPLPALRDGPRAVRLAERAVELTHHEKVIYIGTLAAAYAEAGRFAEAVNTAQKAIALAARQGQQDLLQRNENLLPIYQSGRAFHQTPPE